MRPEHNLPLASCHRWKGGWRWRWRAPSPKAWRTAFPLHLFENLLPLPDLPSGFTSASLDAYSVPINLLSLSIPRRLPFLLLRPWFVQLLSPAVLVPFTFADSYSTYSSGSYWRIPFLKPSCVRPAAANSPKFSGSVVWVTCEALPCCSFVCGHHHVTPLQDEMSWKQDACVLFCVVSRRITPILYACAEHRFCLGVHPDICHVGWIYRSFMTLLSQVSAAGFVFQLGAETSTHWSIFWRPHS